MFWINGTLNIIYSDGNDNQMIIEAQFSLIFLLTCLLNAKTMGHKYYDVTRMAEFVDNITNQAYTSDNNYDKYRLKINQFIDNDTKNLNQMFFCQL